MYNNIMKTALFCLICGLLILGCSEKITNNSSGGTKISMAAKIDNAEMSQLIVSFQLTVDAEDFTEPVVTPLELDGSYLVGEVIVPAGLNRTFLVQAFDDLGNVIYEGSTTADVVYGETVDVDINLFPVVPLLKVTPRNDRILMGEQFVINIYAYNVPDIRSAQIDFGYLTIGPQIVYLLDVVKGNGLPADSRLSWESSNASVYIWLGVPDQSDPLTDENGNAHLATVYFGSHSDTDRDYDTVSLEITPIQLNRGISDVMDLFPLDSLYIENTEYELYRDLTPQ